VSEHFPDCLCGGVSCDSRLDDGRLRWRGRRQSDARGRDGFDAGVEAEMMCQNVGFYTSGVINGPSILFKLPPGTEIVSPTNGSVLSVSSAPAPHEYTKSVAITGMPFIIYVYFIGDVKVAANAPLVRGDVIGVSTGTFPTDSPPDSKLNGASVLINLLGYDSRMIDASSSDVWAGGVPTCYAP